MFKRERERKKVETYSGSMNFEILTQRHLKTITFFLNHVEESGIYQTEKGSF